jgi:hypothetical protein
VAVKGRMLRLVGRVLVAAGIVLAGCGGAPGDDGNANGGGGNDVNRAELTARLPGVSVAERLVAMDERAFGCAGRRGCAPSRGDSPVAALVTQADTQLLNLSFKCTGGGPGVLADYTVKAQKVLAEHGKDASLVGILTNVNGSIPVGSPRRPCSDAFDNYVALVPRGRVRDAALQTND